MPGLGAWGAPRGLGSGSRALPGLCHQEARQSHLLAPCQLFSLRACKPNTDPIPCFHGRGELCAASTPIRLILSALGAFPSWSQRPLRLSSQLVLVLLPFYLFPSCGRMSASLPRSEARWRSCSTLPTARTRRPARLPALTPGNLGPGDVQEQS